MKQPYRRCPYEHCRAFFDPVATRMAAARIGVTYSVCPECANVVAIDRMYGTRLPSLSESRDAFGQRSIRLAENAAKERTYRLVRW